MAVIRACREPPFRTPGRDGRHTQLSGCTSAEPRPWTVIRRVTGPCSDTTVGFAVFVACLLSRFRLAIVGHHLLYVIV